MASSKTRIAAPTTRSRARTSIPCTMNAPSVPPPTIGASVAVATTWTADDAPGQDHRQCHRDLDLSDDLWLAHAHAPPRLDQVAVDLAHARIRVGDDRGYAEEDQRDHRGRETEAAATEEDQQRGEHDAEPPDRRDRPADVGHRDDGGRPTPGVTDGQADRQRDGGGHPERHGRQ